MTCERCQQRTKTVGDCGYCPNCCANFCTHRHCACFTDERRRQGLCPVCGERIRLVGNTTDGRYTGSCGDAFSPRQWRTLGPQATRCARSARRGGCDKRCTITVLLIGEFEVSSDNPLANAAAQLDAFREAVQPAAEYGLTLYQATAADLARCAGCTDFAVQHGTDDGPCLVPGCSCKQFISGPPDTPGAPA